MVGESGLIATTVGQIFMQQVEDRGTETRRGGQMLGSSKAVGFKANKELAFFWSNYRPQRKGRAWGLGGGGGESIE